MATTLVLTRRLAQAVGIAAVVALGVLLILSATGATGDAWRRDGADWLRDVAHPDIATWVVALVGVALAVVGLVVLVSQLLPGSRGSHRLHSVHETARGDTRIRGGAVLRSVEHTVRQIDQVVDAEARWSGTSSVHVDVHVDDEANVADVEAAVRNALGHPFWIDLGLADVAVDMVVVHGASPRGRARRVR